MRRGPPTEVRLLSSQWPSESRAFIKGQLAIPLHFATIGQNAFLVMSWISEKEEKEEKEEKGKGFAVA